MNFKTTLALGLAGLISVSEAATSFEPIDYVRALWMATRFYGGQRSGDGPNWLSIGKDAKYLKSFTHDSLTVGGTKYDLSGGWFDCGDHVMFGQTQYWAAYSLAKAYEAFPKGFHDLYNGVDYSDYKANSKWNEYNGGTPNGIPDIIDELVYEADYVAKAAISTSAFVTKKGEGDPDHSNWITPGEMSYMSKSEGGECTSGGGVNWNTNPPSVQACTQSGPRLISTDVDQSMASNAAAFLATMSRILTQLSIYPERASLYRAKAKIAFDYADTHTGAIAYYGKNGLFYVANPNQADDYVNGALEMFALTGESTYQSKAIDKSGSVNKDHNWAFNYNNADDMAWYNLFSSGTDDAAIDQLKKYADYYKGKVNSEGLSTVGDPTWGSLRYPIAGAYVMALASKASSSTSWDAAIYSNVGFVMGKNSNNRSFITGFAKGSDKSPQHPHHRGVYSTSGIVKDENQNALTIPTKNQSHGSLVGSTGYSSGNFNDQTKDYMSTEVCNDYNVGLVGALAYIVSKLAPSDQELPIFNPSALTQQSALSSFSLARSAGTYEFSHSAGKPFTVDVYDLRGNKVASLRSAGESLRFAPVAAGVFHAQVRGANSSASYKLTGI